MNRTYIGLGSNLNNPEQQVKDAIDRLSRLSRSSLIAVSPFYASKPMGPQDQPDYVNAVAALDTDLSPLELLERLQFIERQQGRVRIIRWGARTIDLDILLYGNQVLQSETLTIPHPGIKDRPFVIQPLLDIAPDLVLPDGTVLKECGNNLSKMW